MTMPRYLLHIEGAALLLGACLFYHSIHGSWWWFAALILTPDVVMLGYLIDKKTGAAIYNLGHSYVIPLLLFSGLWFFGHESYRWLVTIWMAHIGMDRTVGYGLKYKTSFKDTHLQRV